MENKTILVICTGNICRSPMAAAFLQDRLAQDPARAGWRVRSAGLWAMDGARANRQSSHAMREKGHDLTHHSARRVTAEMVAEADLVLGLTPNHVEALRAAFPKQAHKIHLLAEMAGYSHGVKDPFGEPYTTHQIVAREIQQIVETGYEQIVRHVEEKAAL